jgi:hypothetical protein
MLAPNLFDHLRPVAKFHEHVMHGVHIPASNPKPVALHLAYCGKGTRFWNAITKFKTLADDRAATKRAAEVFSRMGIVGWANVEHDGQALPYSSEIGGQVLEMLVDADRADKVDAALVAAMNPDNFTEPVVEAAELGKK